MMEDDELELLCERISTWDQTELDGLLGQPAIDYARKQERDVRRVAREMWAVFPLGPKWWMINSSLKACRKKAAAIHRRANKIGEDRKAGRIIERNGRLVYRSE